MNYLFLFFIVDTGLHRVSNASHEENKNIVTQNREYIYIKVFLINLSSNIIFSRNPRRQFIERFKQELQCLLLHRTHLVYFACQQKVRFPYIPNGSGTRLNREL